MQKIVFGIIAVFFVQIAFQLFVNVEQTNDEYAAIGNFEAPAGEIDNYANVDGLFDESTLVEEDEIAPVRIAQRAAPKRGEAVHATYRPRVTPISPTQAKALFPPVIITPSPRPAPVEQRSLTASYVEKKPSKSLPAKALTVVKKPFDWMKSAVSKLL